MSVVVLAGSVGLLNLFVYCYFGKLATESFEQMADSLYESNWSNLPVRLQKYVLLIILNTQRPLRYHGFHLAYLDLETFSRVSFHFQRNLLSHKRLIEFKLNFV